MGGNGGRQPGKIKLLKDSLVNQTTFVYVTIPKAIIAVEKKWFHLRD